MSSAPKNQGDEQDEQPAASVNEIEKLVEAWASSKEGTEKLRTTQISAKAAADFVDTEVEIDPVLLHRSVTL